MIDNNKLNKMTVLNKGFGKVNNCDFYMTDDMCKMAKESKIKDRSMLEAFREGSAMQFMKHLFERIKDKDPKAEIILTLEKNRKEKNQYYINYNDYKRVAFNRWIYGRREIGLNASLTFLNLYFPTEFDSPLKEMSQNELNKVERNFSAVIEELSRKLKNKKELLKRTAGVVERLGQEEQVLKRSVRELEELHRRSTISLYMQRLAEFRDRLQKHYHETRGKNCWQNWIFANNWMFGVQYLDPLPKEKVGFNQIPDYVFPTLDGFMDILDIKRPDRDVLVLDRSHRGAYSWSSEANNAIGQVANYIHEMELHQLELWKNWNREFSSRYGQKLYIVRPRAFILIGQSDNWDEPQEEALRKMNYHLHGIEVLTYTDLYHRGESLISFYTRRTT